MNLRNNWNVLILPLKIDGSSQGSDDQIFNRLLDRLGQFSDPSDALQKTVTLECQGRGLSLVVSPQNSTKELILRMIGHYPDQGPIIATPFVRTPEELTACLTILNWVRNEAQDYPALTRILKVYPILAESAAPNIRSELLKHSSSTGLFLANAAGEIRLLNPTPLTEGWEPPASYWEDLGEATLLKLRLARELPPQVSLSAWIPDTEVGAKLFFYQTTNRMPPEELTGTAAMLFAMEEMGQVDLGEFGFTVQDTQNALISVREKDHGRLLGVILISGGDHSSISQEVAFATGAELQACLKTQLPKGPKAQREQDQHSALRSVLSDIASDCCVLGLETYLPSVPTHREKIVEPNEPSSTVKAGGTQNFVLLTGAGFTLCLNLSYLEGNLKEMVASALKLSIEKTTVEVIRDFFREYLNQTIGWTQKALGRQGVYVKLGIPLAVTTEEVVPTFLKNQFYDSGSTIVVGKFRFEIRVSAQIENAAEILHIRPQDVKAAITSKQDEVDIDALLDGREALSSPVDQIISALAEFRRVQAIPPEVSISGWVPDAEEGAGLRFFNTRNRQAPDELFGTAAMFFAMEEMGQVDTAETSFQKQDPTNVLVSVREKEMGKLLGALLFVGDGAEDVSSTAAKEFVSRYRNAFVGEPKKSTASIAASDKHSSSKAAITQIALDSSLLRLESYIPGRRSHQEPLHDPNEPSRALQAGATQSLILLSGQGVTILFNLVFLEGNLKDLVSESLRLQPEATSVEIIRDYFREYLNQVVGWAQKVLGHQQLPTKLSLPISISSGTAIPSYLEEIQYTGAVHMVIERFRFEIRIGVKIAETAELPEIVAKNIQETLDTAKEEVDIEALLDAL